MRRVASVLFLLCLLFVFPSCASQTAPHNPPIAVTPSAPPPPSRLTGPQIMADRLPSDALIAIGFRGSDDLGPEYPDSNLKGLLDATKAPDQLNKYLPMLVDLISQK